MREREPSVKGRSVVFDWWWRAGMRRRTTLTGWLLATCLGLASPLGAQSLAGDVPAVAVGRYTLGRTLYRQKDFVGALREFMVARELAPKSASLTYNLARTFERLDRVTDAIRYYELYLELVPEADDRVQVVAVIAGLRRLLATEQTPPKDDPKSASPEPEPPPLEPVPVASAEVEPASESTTLGTPTTRRRATRRWPSWAMRWAWSVSPQAP